MKKYIFPIALIFFVLSCADDDTRKADTERDDGEYSYALSDGKGGGGSSGSSSGGNGQTNPEPGQITAGEWNDLGNWDFWNNLQQEQDYADMHEYWSYDLSDRISFNVEGSSGIALSNLKVELIDETNNVVWRAVTDNKGNAEIWPGLSENPSSNAFRISINDSELNSFDFYSQGVNHIELNIDQSVDKKIDIAFVVDATGSMSDELEYLKVELIDVLETVQTDNPNATITTGTVFYRDEGDDYVTKFSDFTTNVNTTISFIREQSADGGGDFPEAVNIALSLAIDGLQWSSTSISRVIFLLLDAPPHYEEQVVDEIHELVQKASDSGIKIVPITASGIDKETEFLMRYMAIATNGTYVFITNDSGIGGEHLEPSIGEYEVEYLNELLIRLINGYLE